MPWGVAAGVLGSAAGAAVSSAMAPSVSGSGSNLYTPTGLGTADTTWQNLLSQLYGYEQPNAATINSGANSAYNALQGVNSQYGTGYQNAANSAASTYENLANTLNTQAGSDYGTAANLLSAGQNTYNQSSVNNTALYNQYLNQMQQQTGATNSMYGLGSSAAGAGVQNQALSNFNIDWNAQQLQNQIAGLQAYGQAANQAGQYLSAGNQAASAAPGYALESGSLPYTTAQTIAGSQNNALSSLSSILNSGVYGAGTGLQSQIIPYLNYGQGATSNAYNAAMQNAQNMGNTASSAVSGLGTALQNSGAFSNMFGSSSNSSLYGSGYSDPSLYSTSSYYTPSVNTYGFSM